jgi:predicted RNase H-like HicB family nuclease
MARCSVPSSRSSSSISTPGKAELHRSESPEVLKTLSIGKAAGYTLANWERLTRFVTDPAIPLDSNATERGIRGPEHGYDGNKTAFYALVPSVRPPRAAPVVRFEGLPGEFSQHDFGHVDVTFVERGRRLRLDGPSPRTEHLPKDELDDDDQTDPGIPEHPEDWCQSFRNAQTGRRRVVGRCAWRYSLGMRTFTAVIERDATTGVFVGYVPGFPGAHSQGATVDELRENLAEVLTTLLEDGEPKLEGEFVGTQTVKVA